MAAMTNSEWDDIPTSSELFGGDFFGDELMEMYTADGGLNLGDNSSSVIASATAQAASMAAASGMEDDAGHPGLLIAMNAAAMDGGLSPLGSAVPEFAPIPAMSDGALPPYTVAAMPAPAPVMAPAAAPMMAAAPAPLPAPLAVAPAPLPAPPLAPLAVQVQVKMEPAAAAPQLTLTMPVPVAAPVAAPAAMVPAAVTSAPSVAALAAPVPMAPAPVAPVPIKRPVAAVTVPSQIPSKKPKLVAAPVAALPRPVAAVPARLAVGGGIKVALPPTAPAAVPRAMGRAAMPPARVPAPALARPAMAPVPGALLKKPLVPLAVKPVGGVLPKARMPVGGGINHAVLARPSAVPSSAAAVAAHRILPPVPAPAIARAAVGAYGVPRPPHLPVSSICPTTGVKRAATEADFKDVASAAVSSLIQNASSSLKTGPKTLVAVKPGATAVDTSTAHINALTSQNWVTACNPIPTPDPSSSTSAAACDKAARNARRATLTQEERAKQNRDRNREHARNTRLRKKAYVEELKRTLTELVSQRDAADLEKRHEAQRNREQREVRFRVMEEFLKLRGRNEANGARWVAILEDGFTFTLPKTGFRRMVATEKVSSDVDADGGAASSTEQVLRGAATAMEDSVHLAAYLQTIGGPSTATPPAQVQIVYRCDRKRFFMDANVAFLDFTASTLGAVAKGAAREVAFRGSMKSSFSPASNKLISVEVHFDTASVVQQVEALSAPATGDAAAAAAHEADALLDSLQMPQIFVEKKDVAAAHAAAAAGPVSVSSDDGERSTDASLNP